mmetsp:Transcript_72386/g.186703  ORF Transcript_72386/g.186703 Transcript_72386/m.186703 type:complete len:228 (-) Transcript_72386:955-1638(-)
MAITVMSSVTSSSSCSHCVRACCARLSTLTATLSRPIWDTSLTASALFMNSQIPSEQHRMHWSTSTENLRMPGWWMTPTWCATRSPTALDIARPGVSCPRAKIRCGTSPSMRTTSPPLAMTRRRSSGSCGLWSAVLTRASPLLVGGRVATQRESPHQAKIALRARRSTTQMDRVAPLKPRSKFSSSAHFTRVLCVWSKMVIQVALFGMPPEADSSASSSRQEIRAAQ